MKVSVSTPYRENAIVNITKEATRKKKLNKFYTTPYSAKWNERSKRLSFAK